MDVVVRVHAPHPTIVKNNAIITMTTAAEIAMSEAAVVEIVEIVVAAGQKNAVESPAMMTGKWRRRSNA